MQLAYSYRRTLLLSFVGGYVDTLGFIALFGLFTAHITGNFILLGSMLVHPASGVILKLCAFPAFVLSVALTRLVVLWYDQRQRAPSCLLLLVEALLLSAFMSAGLLGQPMQLDTDTAVITAGILGAAAMGMQHTASGALLSPQVPTTVMTGNVTQLIINVVDMLYSQNPLLRAQSKIQSAKLLPAIVAFAVGSVCAGLAYLHLSFWALCLPIALLLVLAFRHTPHR